MNTPKDKEACIKNEQASHRLRNFMILFGILIVWVLLDQLTKAWFEQFSPSVVISSLIPGVLDFTLVHNTGAAWGIFSNATVLLAIVSMIVCVVAVVYLAFIPTASIGTTVGLSLIVAGGIGNAIDRIVNGYVIDFISVSCIDFPVFNIADIGVTCGLVIFLASIARQWISASKDSSE